MEDYRTIQGVSLAEIEEKRSRFIARAAFADSEEKALAVLAAVRAEHRTARHNVYAYMLREGSRTRYSDDGEPAKTAGLPVLEAIRHAGVTDCIVVVTRYFGGTLLGTGGLVRAYTESASQALAPAVGAAFGPRRQNLPLDLFGLFPHGHGATSRFGCMKHVLYYIYEVCGQNPFIFSKFFVIF